jgi:uncharacterized protein YkwD
MMMTHQPKTITLIRIVTLLMVVLIVLTSGSTIQAQFNLDKRVFLPLLIHPAKASTPPVGSGTPGSCLTSEEMKLANLINEYRGTKGLPPAPISKAMTMVAQYHVLDLENNNPATGVCNMHSWSDKGIWTPVCYTSDHKNASGMWIKPKEITQGKYTANGYEISYWHSVKATAEGALTGWKNSSGHNNVMIEAGIWSGKKWPAMGIGIYKRNAVVWFGDKADSMPVIGQCK